MNNQPPLDTRYPDLLEGQDDPALSRLVWRLDALYTANQPPARLIHPPEARPVRQAPSPAAPMPPAGTFAVASRPVRRWSRLNTLAAVVFTLLLVGALSGTFYLLRRDTRSGPATPTPGIASTPVATPAQSATPQQSLARGPRPCPEQVASSAYWEPIVAPYAYGGAHHVEQVSCANIQGTPALQALVTVRRADAARTLDVFVFTNILDARPMKLFQLMGLVQGDAKISAYSTLMTAQADQLSAPNAGKATSAMTADLFREFKWSANPKTLVQTAFPGMFPDMTRYQAEADQVQVSQGHQPWKLSATQVAIALAVSLLQWSPNSTATLLSGGGTHDASAVVRVRNSGVAAGTITVTLSRLEGDINSGHIWEVISVGAQGFSFTSPPPLAQVANPVQVTGTGSAFEGVIGNVIVLDHLYASLGQASATGASGMGQTTFSTTVSYQTTFPAGTQEGILFLSVPSNANGSIAAAVMEKVLIKGAPGTT
ncbi:MAG TPA: Gmad2 immunoglobulin-like domain-containing protein [Ktedonobacteraceae bacterium]